MIKHGLTIILLCILGGVLTFLFGQLVNAPSWSYSPMGMLAGGSLTLLYLGLISNA